MSESLYGLILTQHLLRLGRLISELSIYPPAGVRKSLWHHAIVMLSETFKKGLISWYSFFFFFMTSSCLSDYGRMRTGSSFGAMRIPPWYCQRRVVYSLILL